MKAAQVREMRAAGAVEFDVVINIGAMREGREPIVSREVEATLRLLQAGASRIGTSSTHAILTAAQERQPVYA